MKKRRLPALWRAFHQSHVYTAAHHLSIDYLAKAISMLLLLSFCPFPSLSSVDEFVARHVSFELLVSCLLSQGFQPPRFQPLSAHSGGQQRTKQRESTARVHKAIVKGMSQQIGRFVLLCTDIDGRIPRHIPRRSKTNAQTARLRS